MRSGAHRRGPKTTRPGRDRSVVIVTRIVPPAATAAPPAEQPATGRALLADLAVIAAVAAVVLASSLVGWALIHAHVDIFMSFPPIFAIWQPHVGPGTIPALLIALLTVLRGPELAARLSWRPLLLAAYLASLGWTTALTLVDGYQHGIVDKLTSDDEYLHDVPLVHDIPAMLRTFTTHILDFQPGSWTTHVSGHPPGVFLIFVWLDRLGLGGGAPGAVLVLLIGSAACVGVAVTVRALGSEQVARAALPFGVLVPGAVWVGVSADGLFAGVLACGVAMLAIGATGAGLRADLAAFSGGLLLGCTLYFSYGLVLAGLLPLVVLGLTRRLRPTLIAVLGVGVIVAAFTASGFWWFDGYQLVKIRYYQGIAATRPFGYFVWADLAAFALVIGPAVVAGLRRLAVAPRRLPLTAGLLVAAALLAVAAADLSGLSKAEVERIWLPFGMWLVLTTALLPARQVRWWLAAQALLALLVNHLLLTGW